MLFSRMLFRRLKLLLWLWWLKIDLPSEKLLRLAGLAFYVRILLS